MEEGKEVFICTYICMFVEGGIASAQVADPSVVSRKRGRGEGWVGGRGLVGVGVGKVSI